MDDNDNNDDNGALSSLLLTNSYYETDNTHVFLQVACSGRYSIITIALAMDLYHIYLFLV